MKVEDLSQIELDMRLSGWRLTEMTEGERVCAPAGVLGLYERAGIRVYLRVIYGKHEVIPTDLSAPQREQNS